MKKMGAADLIQEVNVLGPWVHGYFDLGNGLIIEDQDEPQRKRLLHLRDYFHDIIAAHYGCDTLIDKTFADIGCNAGYFLFELFKAFQFRRADGLEPRESNLSKARFIADYFNLPKSRVRFREFDLLAHSGKLPAYDIVLMAGLVHHLDNHLSALSNARRMTKELCIIEAIVLPDDVNTPLVQNALELKDDAYKKADYGFGVVGYKFESNFLDGAAAHTGIVGIPTEKALVMMLHHVGFKNIRIYKDNHQMKEEIYNTRSYRDFNSSIIVAESGKEDVDSIHSKINRLNEEVEEENFRTPIPLDIIEPLYSFIDGRISRSELPELANLIYLSEFYYTEQMGIEASDALFRKIGSEVYYRTVITFRHAPRHKIAYEFAKACFHDRQYEKAREILEGLITVCNLDWRTVFRSYYLLARIFLQYNDRVSAKRFNDLSLRAYNHYAPALMLQKRLS